MRAAALAGLGITLLPIFMIHAELATGARVRVDVGLEAEGADIHIAYPMDRGACAKGRALTECLRRAFGGPPH
jgi:DNA-binding transcriptional LysR family regulator